MTRIVRRARAIALTVALAGLVAVLTPIWYLHDRITRAITSRRRASVRPLARVPADGIGVDELLGRRSPVVVEGLAAQLGIANAATPESLRALAGDADLGVAFHSGAAPYFLYSAGYGATVDHRRTMSVSAFLDMMFGDGPDPGTVVYQLLGPRSVSGRISDELARFDRALTPHTSHPTAPQFSGIWIGSTGVVTPLHHDAWPGVLFQTHGRKRVAMYAPVDRSNLSFRPPLAGRGRWSDLPARSGEADPAEFPRLGHTTRFETVLEPGDALFIPPFWPHEMEAIDPNISVPFRFETFRRSYLNPGFLRPAAELTRAKLAA